MASVSLRYRISTVGPLGRVSVPHRSVRRRPGLRGDRAPGRLADEIIHDVEIGSVTADRDSTGGVTDRIGIDSRGDTRPDVNACAGPGADYRVALTIRLPDCP